MPVCVPPRPCGCGIVVETGGVCAAGEDMLGAYRDVGASVIVSPENNSLEAVVEPERMWL